MSAGDILRDEIARCGPIPFRRFMEVALYHPGHGYYARPGADPFGKGGDFFTAAQLQPVYSILIRECVRHLLAHEDEATVVELGAGRGEMADAFSGWRYAPVDVNRGELPVRFKGVVFANEFFDALPVEAATFKQGAWREMRVDWLGDRFAWSVIEAASEPMAAYCREYGCEEEGWIVEAQFETLAWMDRIAARMERGWILAIDYGYTAAERARFPQGSLMSYRRHRAEEDVLSDPGARDITAHVNFTALMRRAAEHGYTIERFERLAQTLLRAGEQDQFSGALAADSDTERSRRQLQLKTLLFGMGETFQTLLLRRTE